MLNYRLLLICLSTLLLRTAWNLTASMNHTYMVSTITAAMANFVPINVKPKENNLFRLRECLTLILLVISYNTAYGYHNL